MNYDQLSTAEKIKLILLAVDILKMTPNPSGGFKSSEELIKDVIKNAKLIAEQA